MNKSMVGVVACVAVLLVASAVVCANALRNDDSVDADMVVFGKIYTSNANSDYAEALAVKDGKYVYVGDEEGVDKYIKKGTTKVIDYRNKGLIMAGATEGHGHYAQAGILEEVGLYVRGSTEKEIIDNVREYVAAHPDMEVYCTFGWDNVKMQNCDGKDIRKTIDMRTQLDAICSDKVLMIGDDSGHTAFCNSKAFEVAGMTAETKIAGGEIGIIDGKLSGFVSDMAYNYILKNAVSKYQIFSEKDYKGICEAMEKSLHSKGYTYYQDGWLNYYGSQAMDCISTYDKEVGLQLFVSGSYKIDSYEDWQAEIANAEDFMKKYPTTHFSYNTLKLFADGEAVESKTGWLIDGYVDGTHGTQVWETEVMNAIVKAANEKGLSVHVHAQGDAASQQTVNAFILAEDTAADGVYNGICHGRNITEETKQNLADHNFYASININWRTLIDAKDGDKVTETLSLELARAGFPVKSLLDKGIVVTSSTDVPAAAGAPTTVSGIIEVAVNDTCADKEVWKLDESERVTVEQAMNIMTINGAKQLQIDNERGSIEVGKFADFLLFDMDFTTCEKDKIHEADIVSVYFEGNEAYTAKA